MKNEKLPKTTITKEATIFPFTSLSHSPPPPPKKIPSDFNTRGQCMVYRLDSKILSYSLALVHSISSWLVRAEIECMVHFSLPRWPIKLV